MSIFSDPTFVRLTREIIKIDMDNFFAMSRQARAREVTRAFEYHAAKLGLPLSMVDKVCDVIRAAVNRGDSATEVPWYCVMGPFSLKGLHDIKLAMVAAGFKLYEESVPVRCQIPCGSNTRKAWRMNPEANAVRWVRRQMFSWW